MLTSNDRNRFESTSILELTGIAWLFHEKKRTIAFHFCSLDHS
uniref:Uncharacterized protein n=1 Tax=Arundo donax TaxID=35708 RepID=A0A0A8XVB1_ARUDO